MQSNSSTLNVNSITNIDINKKNAETRLLNISIIEVYSIEYQQSSETVTP